MRETRKAKIHFMLPQGIECWKRNTTLLLEAPN
jgi:hypothetical protein